MYTHPVQIYIYQLNKDSQCWCKREFLQILPEDEDVIHSSIVVHGTEYSYGENGIEEYKPKLRPQYVTDFDFEEAVSRIKAVGRTNMTKSEVENLVTKLRKDGIWFASKFNPVEHNCHHFSDTFVKLLCGNETVLPMEVYEFNKTLLAYRESWINEFYEDGEFCESV